MAKPINLPPATRYLKKRKLKIIRGLTASYSTHLYSFAAITKRIAV